MVVLSMLRTEESSEMLAAELLAPKNNKNTYFPKPWIRKVRNKES
jgi:hypothetical protein